MAESKGIESALAAMLAKMETMSEEIKSGKIEAGKQNKSLHDENKKLYAAVQEQSKQSKQMIEAAEKRISETVEAMKADIEAYLEVNKSRLNEYGAKLAGMEEQVIQHRSTVSELIAEQDVRCLLYTSRCV